MGRRVLCCSGSLDGGGSERQLVQLAAHIDRHFFEPQIYLHYRRGPFLDFVPEDVPIHAFWSDHVRPQLYLPGRIHALQVSHLERLLRRERIDIVYDRTFHMTLVTAKACQRSGVPRVSVIVSPPSHDFTARRERFHWFKRRSLARAYRTGKTIAVSQEVADDAAKIFHLASQQIQVIPNPVDVQGVRRAAQEPCSWNSLPMGALRIAVVGRFTEEKGHATALLALASAIQRQPTANMQLELIGDGPLRSELQRLAQSLGIAQRVHFRGFMKNPFACMAACELLCLPSTYEGLPNVALESMALGLPVLATRCSQSLVELLGKSAERGVIVPIGDANALADQFIDRSQRPADWLARARCAADWVQEHHSLETWLQRMTRLFDHAIESPPRSVSRDGNT